MAVSAPTIPDYELLQRIGAGGYGEVWLARSVATNAMRAVKIVYRATLTDDRPFQREFEGIKKFVEISRSHLSQLALFHVGRNEAARCFYYVMELADRVKATNLEPRRLTPEAEAQNEALRAGPFPDLKTKCSDAYAPHTLGADLQHKSACPPFLSCNWAWHFPKH